MTTHDDPRLSAPILINTRPDERAAALSEYLIARGVDVVAMPMLALTPCTISAEERGYMQAWLTGAYDALVVISPTAAEYGLALLPTLASSAVPTRTVIGVGQRTLSVLKDSPHLQATTLAMPAISSNEGLIAMPELASLQAGAQVLIWRGHGGRRLLVKDLQARGVQVDSIAWYARTQPTAAPAQYRAWQRAYAQQGKGTPAADKPWVLISSGAAFTHWAQVVTEPLSDFRYLVLGARLYALLQAQNLSCVMLETLSPAHIYHTMQSASG